MEEEDPKPVAENAARANEHPLDTNIPYKNAAPVKVVIQERRTRGHEYPSRAKSHEEDHKPATVVKTVKKVADRVVKKEKAGRP